MEYDYKYFKPVKTAGEIFLFIGCSQLCFTHFFYESNLKVDSFSHFFILVNGFWYSLMGISLIQRRIWGYYLLKLYLYTFVLFFPIGTFIGIKSLWYLRKKDIKTFFIMKSLGL